VKIWGNKYLKKCSIKKQIHKRDVHNIYRLNFTFQDGSEVNLDLTEYDLEIIAVGIKPYYIERQEQRDMEE